MNNEPRDDLDRALAALPSPELSPARAEQIRRRSRSAFSRGSDWTERVEHVYARTLEPVLLFAVVPVHLAWGLGHVWLLLSGG